MSASTFHSKHQRSIRQWIALLFVAATLAVLFLWPRVDSDPSESNWPLRIISSGETHHFTVELALTEEERRQGLMMREDLSEDSGMLFVFERPQVITMWMKNTLLSLDMLFLDADGVIQRIASNTTPRSTQHIIGPPESLYVLELRAGVARKLNIQPQGRVENLPPPGYSPTPSSS